MSRPSHAAVLATALLCALAAAGCGGPPAATPSPSGAPRRIVSLSPNLTEILFALDLGDRVAGVTDFCNFPPEAAAKPKIGGYVNPNLEAILALEPDLALASPNIGNKDAVLRLREMGVPFLVVDVPSLAGLFEAIRSIADRAGVPERGARLAGSLMSQVEAVRRRTARLPRPSTLLVFAHEPLIVAGPGTIYDEMIEAAGGRNLAAGTAARFPHYSLEAILEEGPQAIVETTMTSEGGVDLAFWERWPALPAVRDGRLCAPPPDPLLRPGPRVAEGVRRLAECLHGAEAVPTAAAPAAEGSR